MRVNCAQNLKHASHDGSDLRHFDVKEMLSPRANKRAK